MDKDQIVGSAKDFAGDAKTEAAGQFREGMGAAQNLYGQAKDAARQVSNTAAGYAKDAYDTSGEAFSDGSQAIAIKVQENPLGSMLVAGAIGFALGLLMTRPQRLPPPRRYFG